MDEGIDRLLCELRHRIDFDRAEPLNKGYSDARKYTLYKSGRPFYLLRVHHIASYARRFEEFNYIKRHRDNGVSCQTPILVEASQEWGLCYLLLSYIEGESGDQLLPGLTPEAQYEQGKTAGRQLRLIHKIVPDTPLNWAERRYNKYVLKKTRLKELELQFHKQDEIETYIERHFDCLHDSVVCFQHDDFHPSNLIFEDGRFVGVIDFGRFDWGDPWEEFFKLPKYTCQVSRYFAYGQVVGYFQVNIPDSFWPKYNLFVALNQHATCISGAQSNRIVQTMDNIKLTIQTHDMIGGGPPDWFLDSRRMLGI